MNSKKRLQESEFEIIGEASDGEELELTHERKREIDAILKRTEQEIAEGKIQYIPWRECIKEIAQQLQPLKGAAMISLSSFSFPDDDMEWRFYLRNEKPEYSTYYPFGILRKYDGLKLDFAPLTILYGGNGSGKTTILNIIAEKIGAQRTATYNRSSFYEDYLELCRYEFDSTLPEERRIITSDDVFDYMLDLRALNKGIDNKRDSLMFKYQQAKRYGGKVNVLDDYAPISLNCSVRGLNTAEFVNKYLGKNIREHSNGETAIKYFYDNLQENGLYLLDEPENSLSPKRQQELAEVLYEHVHHLGCQMVISTHSPFMLAIDGALIYDLDDKAQVKEWTELSGVRAYYDFFKAHEREFYRLER